MAHLSQDLKRKQKASIANRTRGQCKICWDYNQTKAIYYLPYLKNQHIKYMNCKYQQKDRHLSISHPPMINVRPLQMIPFIHYYPIDKYDEPITQTQYENDNDEEILRHYKIIQNVNLDFNFNVDHYGSNKWGNQQIRKKINYNNVIGEYYRRKENKTWKWKLAKRRGSKRRQLMQTVQYQTYEMTVSHLSSVDEPGDNEKDIDNIPIWQCQYCTYINIERLSFCSICHSPLKYYDVSPKCQSIEIDINDIMITTKNKTKRNRKRKHVQRKIDNTKEFASYWQEMQNVDKRLKKYAIKQSEKLYKEKLQTMTPSDNHSAAPSVLYITPSISKQKSKKKAKWKPNMQLQILMKKSKMYSFNKDIKAALCMIKLHNSQNHHNQIKIIDGIFEEASLKILNETGGLYTSYQLSCTKDNTHIPIVVSSPFEFDSIHHSVEKIKSSIHNFTANCVWKLEEKKLIRVWGDEERELQFNKCHEPYYNLLPSSFTISRILFEFVPSIDILKNILIPYIGYDDISFVVIDIVWPCMVLSKCEKTVDIEVGIEMEEKKESSQSYRCAFCGVRFGLFGCYCDSSSDEDSSSW